MDFIFKISKKIAIYIFFVNYISTACLYAHSLYTPNGSPVCHGHETNWEEWEVEYWTNVSDDLYEGVYEERMAPANYAYNCHSYAWGDAREEYPSSWSGIGFYEYDEEDIYWEDFSYIETNVSDATHVSYRVEDHSLQLTGEMIDEEYEVISKWGSFPLYRHKLWSDPYELESSLYTKYYKILPDPWVITSNVTINKHINMHSNIIVQNGATLTITSGRNIKFAPLKGLDVYGTLNLENIVILKPQYYTWSGIEIFSGGSLSLGDDVKIENA